MLLAFQDRLRIPWHGGAKRVSIGALISVFGIPFIITAAAINIYFTIIMVLLSLIFIGYSYYYVNSKQLKTRFFFMWSILSSLFMVILFELTVPLLELLPEENFIFVLIAGVAIFFLWQTRKLAIKNDVLQNNVIDSMKDSEHENDGVSPSNETNLVLEPDAQEETDITKKVTAVCKNYSMSHCIICSSCVSNWRYHSYWLDCCIDEKNYQWYMLGLFFSEIALLLGSNLTLTAICHPRLMFRVGQIPIMLPDDCSEVYDDYQLSISFVISLYALIEATCVLFVLFYNFFMLLRRTNINNEFSNRRQKIKWSNGFFS